MGGAGYRQGRDGDGGRTETYRGPEAKRLAFVRTGLPRERWLALLEQLRTKYSHRELGAAFGRSDKWARQRAWRNLPDWRLRQGVQQLLERSPEQQQAAVNRRARRTMLNDEVARLAEAASRHTQHALAQALRLSQSTVSGMLRDHLTSLSPLQLRRRLDQLESRAPTRPKSDAPTELSSAEREQLQKARERSGRRCYYRCCYSLDSCYMGL